MTRRKTHHAKDSDAFWMKIQKFLKEWFIMKNSRKPLIIVSMALLLAVVLAMGGVTFAKYISTTNTGSNTAKVAAWGFTLSTEYGDMFGPTYDWNTATPAVVVDADDAGSLVVKASTNTADNLVAPGTSGSMSFTIGGTAEVRSQFYVAVAGQEVSLTGGDLNTDVYYPIDWTLTHNGTALVTDGRLSEVLAEIKKIDLDIYAANAEANTDAKDIRGEYVISWRWDFEQGTNDAVANDLIDTYTNDKWDTILGQTAAGNAQLPAGYTANLNVDLYIAITVAQIQDDNAPATVDPTTYPVAP